MVSHLNRRIVGESEEFHSHEVAEKTRAINRRMDTAASRVQELFKRPIDP